MRKVTLKQFPRRFVATIALVLVPLAALAASSAGSDRVPPLPRNAEREAYYGDLHLFSSYAFAGYLDGTTLDPDGVYRFARGEPVTSRGEKVRRSSAPLDFLAVTDPGENLGLFNTLDDPQSPFAQTEMGRAVRAHDPQVFNKVIDLMLIGRQQPLLGVDPATVNAVTAAAWQREIEAANRNYRPGKFTTFIAYHWTDKLGGHNLDRVVLFRGDTAPRPFTSFDSNQPEDLWTFLEHNRQQGYDALAIPHHANLSDGLMFNGLDSAGRPIDRAYAARRAANEPLIEIANISQGETHPALSPEDEFASFELFGLEQMTQPKGSYVRDALGRGMEIAQQIGVNPYPLGFVGGTDLSDGLSDAAEDAYLVLKRELAPTPSIPSPPQPSPGVAVLYPELRMTPTTPGSGSLAGVWAEQNTREAIFAALRRKETFATSGTRLKFRFFAGWDYDSGLLKSHDWVKAAYRGGAPMGGDLPATRSGRSAPTFVAWAIKDPAGANLDRLQIVKLWLEKGQYIEKIYDVALSGGRQIDPKTGRAPVVGNTVDLQKATYTNTIGAPELAVVWRDPHFDPTAPAAYYLRVLEIPTPRWSTIVAVKRGQPLPAGVPATIQERGWSSPVWFTPKR